MITPQFHIPEGELSSELLQLIPPDDTILYTSAVAVRKCGFASALKFGQLAITNRGLAFTAKRRGLTGGIMALRGGPILQYVSFDRVEIIKNLGRMVRIRVTPHPSEADSKAVHRGALQAPRGQLHLQGEKRGLRRLPRAGNIPLQDRPGRSSTGPTTGRPDPQRRPCSFFSATNRWFIYTTTPPALLSPVWRLPRGSRTLLRPVWSITGRGIGER